MKLFNNTSKAALPLLTGTVLALLSSSAAHAQIFEVNGQSVVTNPNSSSVGEYNLDGTVDNSSVLGGLQEAESVAVSGSDVFVGTFGSVIEYNTATGTSQTIVSGLGPVESVTVANGNLYFDDGSTNDVYSYNLAAGGTFNQTSTNPANKLTPIVKPSGSSYPVQSPEAMAVIGNDLFVVSSGTGSIVEFNATTGAVINPNLYTYFGGAHNNVALSSFGMVAVGSNLYLTNPAAGVVTELAFDSGSNTITNSATVLSLSGDPTGLAISGDDLFVSDANASTISEYTLGSAFGTVTSTTPSWTIDPDGINGVFGLAVVSVPEPSSWMLGALVCSALAFLRLRQRSA
ncbi:MAG: hypothetical protein WDO13_05520 [Verrucomicrobiota bacterium]